MHSVFREQPPIRTKRTEHHEKTAFIRLEMIHNDIMVLASKYHARYVLPSFEAYSYPPSPIALAKTTKYPLFKKKECST